MGGESRKKNKMIHPTAIIETDYIHPSTNIWAHTHISKGAMIGKNCTIGENVYIGEEVSIGNGCRIQNGAQIYKGVIIEDNVFIGPNVVTTNDIFPQLPVDEWSDRFKATLIKSGASIGANSTIVCGIIINESAMIGAGSVVTKSIPKSELWYGNPAKFKRTI